MTLRRISTLLPVLALAAACGRDRAPAAFRSETLPGGAVQAINPEQGAWTEATAWKAVEDLRIGTAEGSGPDVLAGPAALEVDPAGRLYVLDAMTMNVRVFGPDGRHLRSMGRKGRGPGELSQPAGMALAPDGSLWVADPGNVRYTVFDSAGANRPSVPRSSRMNMMPWPGRFDRTGHLWDVAEGPDGFGGAPALLRIDPASGQMARVTLPTVPAQEFATSRGGVSTSAPVPFSPRLAWMIDGDGNVWSADTGRYRIVQRHPRGDSLRIVTRENTPVPVSSAERDSVPIQLKWFTDQGGRVDVSRVPRNKPALQSLATDDRGWLWVRPSVPAGEQNTVLDVFDPEGRYHGRMTLPVTSLAEPLIRGQHIYTMTLNESGVPQVVRFRIQGRPAA
jgi:sugar lactone lactonase YvrE